MNKNILLVEDDAETADYIRNGFAQSGYVVDTLVNGRDALFQASDGHYGAIILDRMLPDLDGLSVLKGLRAAGVKTPVLLLSALAMVDERVRGLQAGADDYLAKPYIFSELMARVEVMLRRADNAATAPTTLVRRKVSRAAGFDRWTSTRTSPAPVTIAQASRTAYE